MIVDIQIKICRLEQQTENTEKHCNSQPKGSQPAEFLFPWWDISLHSIQTSAHWMMPDHNTFYSRSTNLDVNRIQK
jgi:hypothetical protein